MPDVTIAAPVAADPIDRLILGSGDARSIPGGRGEPANFDQNFQYTVCMAGE